MHCIQVNKLLSKVKTKNDLCVVVKYGNQKRQTTYKKNCDNLLWFESFLIVLDKDIDHIRLELYEREKKYDKFLFFENVKINRSKMKADKLKHFEVQHGKLHYDLELKVKNLTNDNERLEMEVKKLKEYKEMVLDINELINGSE